MAKIREAQLDLAMPAVIKVDMDRHSFYLQNGITLHLSKQGQATFGAAMAQAFKEWRLHQLQ